jgi:hypothetical protein
MRDPPIDRQGVASKSLSGFCDHVRQTVEQAHCPKALAVTRDSLGALA